MGSASRFLLRWFSYPAIFGGISAAMIWLLYQGIPTGQAQQSWRPWESAV